MTYLKSLATYQFQIWVSPHEVDLKSNKKKKRVIPSFHKTCTNTVQVVFYRQVTGSVAGDTDIFPLQYHTSTINSRSEASSQAPDQLLHIC